ncbi:SPT2 chromatin family protein [Acanthocheilonema viteae]
MPDDLIHPPFVIPKKKTRDDSDVDKSRVALFLKKQEEEKRKTLTEKKKQKEELIKLRLQSYGGKANKKLAKQFGSTPIELQQKYGNDREHEEHLKKQQIKEKEESDRLNNELRGNIVKALERKKVVEKMAGAGSCRNGPYRIAINKKNSLRYLTKEDSPGPSSSCVSEGKSRKIDTKIVSKRRLPPSESNFLFLMKKAEAIQNGKASPSPPLPSPPPAKKKTHNELLPRDIREIKFPEDKSKPTSRNNKKAATIQRSNVTKRMNDIQTGHTKEQKVPPFISSGSTSTPSSRRYLPGDIRYQGPAPEQSQTSVKMNNNPSIVAKTNVKESDNKDIQARGPRRINKENLARAGDQQQNPSIQMMSQERAISRFKTHKHLHLKEQRRLEEMRRLREDDELDEDVDDEEYDSEMDDFIDDSEFDEHLKRGDLEETLRLINPRYDKNRWKLRERMIDDRHMEASYRDIAREEKQSSRIGLIEDIREAYCGKSITL